MKGALVDCMERRRTTDPPKRHQVEKFKETDPKELFQRRPLDTEGV